MVVKKKAKKKEIIKKKLIIKKTWGRSTTSGCSGRPPRWQRGPRPSPLSRAVDGG